MRDLSQLKTSRYRILITGSRTWNLPELILDQLEQTIKRNPSESGYTVVHGDYTGADMMASWAAEKLRDEKKIDIEIEAYPADWSKYGGAAGPIRNAKMVSLGADICLAFQRGNSPGTASCIDLAEKAEIPVSLFPSP